MAIIKDLVELGKQLAELQAAVSRLDSAYQSLQYREFELRERVENLEKANNILRTAIIRPHGHWWK